MYDPRFEPASGFSDAEITEIEGVLGRSLPADYREFVKIYGGAFVGGSVDGSPEFPVLNLFEAGRDGGVIGIINIYDDLKRDRILPFACNEIGNLYVQDLYERIFYINYYGGGETSSVKVSNSFMDFISRIVVADE